MTLFLTILIVLASVLLVLLVLVQNSKGGGLASGFQSGNQVMGAPKTADFLEKASWWLIGIIVVLSVMTIGFQNGAKNHVAGESQISEQIDEAASALQQSVAVPDFGEEEAE